MCCWNLRPGWDDAVGANSPSFSIIGEERELGGIVFGLESSTSTPVPATTASEHTNGNMAPETSTPDNGTSDGSTAAPVPQSSVDQGGLSPAQSAGIGAGVGLGILAVALGVIWFWRDRRYGKARRNERTGQEEWRGSKESWERKGPENLKQPVNVRHDRYRCENQGKFLAELSSAHTPAEIATSQILDPRHPLVLYHR